MQDCIWLDTLHCTHSVFARASISCTSAVCLTGAVLLGQIEATDKSASIRVAFSAAADADALSRSLRGVTVKIKGVKLHAFVRVSARVLVHSRSRRCLFLHAREVSPGGWAEAFAVFFFLFVFREYVG